MNPIQHPLCNYLIPSAPGDEGTVNPLHVRIDGNGFTSFWRPSPTEIEILQRGGTVAMLTAAPRLVPARLYIVDADMSEPQELRDADVAIELCNALHEIRKDPGEDLTIHSDNDDFNDQPTYHITCRGDWTDWEDRHFSGDHLLLALRDALAAKRTWRARHPNGLQDPPLS